MERLTTLGERIAYLRTSKNLTQRQLMEALDFNNLSRYENNERTPGIDVIIRIAKFFNVSTDWLLTEKGKGPEDVQVPTTLVEPSSKPDGITNDVFKYEQLVNSSYLKGCLRRALTESFSAFQQKAGGANRKDMIDADNVVYLSEKITEHLQETLPKNPMLKYLNELILPFDELRNGPTKENIMLLITLLEKELIDYKDESAIISEKVNEYEMKLLYNYRKLNERNQGAVDNFVRERLCESKDIIVRLTDTTSKDALEN